MGLMLFWLPIEFKAIVVTVATDDRANKGLWFFRCFHRSQPHFFESLRRFNFRSQFWGWPMLLIFFMSANISACNSLADMPIAAA